MHVASPCPAGWGYPASDTVKIGRLAVESGVVILYEVEEGELRLTGKSLSIARSGRKKPVNEYLQAQRRFSKMLPELVGGFQKEVDRNWEDVLSRAKL